MNRIYFNDLYASNGSDIEMDKNGTLSTPIIFTIDKIANHDVYINQLILWVKDSKFKDGKFGDINNLSNGLKVEYILEDETTRVLLLAKNNEDLVQQSISIAHGYGDEFETSKKPKCMAFELAPDILLLRRDKVDKIQVTIQDPLKKLDFLRLLAKGYKRLIE